MTIETLEEVRAKAKKLGIAFHPRTGVEKLKIKIEQHLNSGVSKKETEVVKTVPNKLTQNDGTSARINTPNMVKDNPVAEVPPVEVTIPSMSRAQQLTMRKKEAAKLIRVRVVCMNPNKKDWPGEIISVGSANVGTFKKYVPFNNENGWHIPHIIYEELAQRTCSVFYTIPGPKGDKIRKSKQVKEFSIEILPSLSKDQLSDLAKQQAMSGSIDN